MKRPLCLVCLLFMALLYAAVWFGMPPAWGNPLPAPVRSELQDEVVQICGEVESSQETDDTRILVLSNAILFFHSKKLPIQKAKVTLTENVPVPCGTVLLVSGKLREIPKPRNPGEFDSRTYYSARKIYYSLESAEIQDSSPDYDPIRQKLADLKKGLYEGLLISAGKDAPTFAAIVLGDRTGLDEETNLLYRMTGIMHLFALSGLHISILGMGLYNVLMKAGAGIWPSSLAAMSFVIPYAVMTGSSFSAIRAVMMFLLAMGGKILGRVYDTLTALAFTAILMLMESPACLYDSGFLMSFMAVAGAAWVLPGITGIVESVPGFQWLGEESAEKTAVAGSFFQTKGKDLLRKGRKAGVKMLLASAAIQLTTLPVTLWFYGEVSLAGIFLNLLILPTAGIVLISAFSTALLGFVGIVRGGSIWLLISAAKMTAIPGRLFVRLYETMSRMASGLPFCTWIGGRPALWQCAMYYLLLACAVFSAYQYRSRIKNTWVLKGGQLIRFVYKCSFFILLLLALPGICFRNRSLFQIAFLDVGQGDGIVIRTPDGQSFMIDGGSSGKKNLAKYQLMPYLKNQGISYVDAIFISHTDLDHISGVLQLLETISSGLTTIRVGTLVLPDWKDPPDTWTELAKAARTAGAKVVTGHRGDVFQGKDVQFRLISPQSRIVAEDINEAGMVMEMTYGNFKALFTGDIGEGTENELLTDGQLEDVDVLKVAHHGSRFSSSDLFLKAVHAETAVISCSENNTYGHPAPETVDRLNEAGCRVEYTMKSGAVTIQTDGERIKVERYIQIKG